MPPDRSEHSSDRQQQVQDILNAIGDAVREALRRHMLLGESVAVAGDNDEVKILDPDGIRHALQNFDKHRTED